MKSYKSLIISGAIALAFSGGCSDSDKWIPGPQDTDTGVSAYFEMPTKLSYIFDTAMTEEEMTINVSVSRALTDEAASIPVKLSSEFEGFELTSPTVDFAAGQTTTTIGVNCSGMAYGEQMNFSLLLPEDQTDIYGQGLLSVGYSVIKSKWLVASDQVSYLYYDASGSKKTYPNTYGILYQLDGTKMFKLEDFFGSGLDIMFECEKDLDGNKGKGMEFVPLNNAEFYYGDEPGWYLFDEENDTYPNWVPGGLSGYSAIDYVSFESDIDYTTIYMNEDKESGYSYIYFTTYLNQADGNAGWGIWYAVFNLDKYNPFE